jgi:putative acetyltransferase
MPIRIRSYVSDDATSLVTIFYNAVRIAGLRDYSQRQVEVWAPKIPDIAKCDTRARDGRHVFVAVNEADEPIAYGDLELSGHIDHLYCRPDLIGHGLGAALYDRLEQEAESLKISRVFVEASEAARRLFLKKGFTETSRNNFMLDGVPMHNYRMEKWLR